MSFSLDMGDLTTNVSRRIPYKWLVAIAFVSGMFMDLMDATIVNVALPTLSRDLRAGIGTLEWVVTGYLISLAIWIPASGWIGDRFGTKKTFAFALAMFTVSSALCGLAWSAGSLIAFRMLQGIGGGMMTPVGTTMLFRAFSQQERAKAAAVITIPTAIAPALGPVLGGWLVDQMSWRWIFYVNVPVGLAALIFTMLFLREHKENAAERFDVWGFVCSGGGLALTLFALSRGPSRGWSSPQVIVSGVAGIALFVALVVIELRKPSPILHLRLLRDRMFRNTNIAMFTVYAMLLGVLFLLPLFLQQFRGLSAFISGLTTAPQALGLLIMSPVSGRLYRRFGARRMLVVALAGIMVISILFLFVDLSSSLWLIRGIMLLRGIFMSLAIVASQAAMFSTISSEETGRASALFNTNRQVASSFGVAVLATVLSVETTAQGVDHLAAFHAAFAASIAFGVLGVVFALRIPGSLTPQRSSAAAVRPPSRRAPCRRDWCGEIQR